MMTYRESALGWSPKDFSKYNQLKARSKTMSTRTCVNHCHQSASIYAALQASHYI